MGFLFSFYREHDLEREKLDSEKLVCHVQQESGVTGNSDLLGCYTYRKKTYETSSRVNQGFLYLFFVRHPLFLFLIKKTSNGEEKEKMLNDISTCTTMSAFSEQKA